MSCVRLMSICLALVIGFGGRSASAQNCFLFFCQQQPSWQGTQQGPNWRQESAPTFSGRPDGQYSTVYAAIASERFPVPAVALSDVDPTYLRRSVHYATSEPAGTIVIDPQRHFLYLVEGGGKAIRYGVGVGRVGFGWSGIATVRTKREWPDWYPPTEMIERQPEIRRVMSQLQSGLGMHGGPRNPLGARALYLWQGNKDTLYRIHGTIEPWTIGKNVSSGCIRMINQDVIDLYERTPIGAKVVVLSSRTSALRP
jgi:lipoprotein-anchoring transpeptidase ErfK/SrfK